MKTSEGSGSSKHKLPCQEDRVFPSESVQRVHVNYVGDNYIWVMLDSDVPSLSFLTDTLNGEDSGERVENPFINQIVSAMNVDDTWYRAKILATKPNISVQFIDFGDTATVAAENVAPLPSSLSALKPLAMRIILSPDAAIEPVVGCVLNAKHIASVNGVAVVQATLADQEIVGSACENSPADGVECSSPSEIVAETITDGKVTDPSGNGSSEIKESFLASAETTVKLLSEHSRMNNVEENLESEYVTNSSKTLLEVPIRNLPIPSPVESDFEVKLPFSDSLGNKQFACSSEGPSVMSADSNDSDGCSTVNNTETVSAQLLDPQDEESTKDNDSQASSSEDILLPPAASKVGCRTGDASDREFLANSSDEQQPLPVVPVATASFETDSNLSLEREICVNNGSQTHAQYFKTMSQSDFLEKVKDVSSTTLSLDNPRTSSAESLNYATVKADNTNPLPQEKPETDGFSSSLSNSALGRQNSDEINKPNKTGLKQSRVDGGNNAESRPFMSALGRYPHLGGGYGQDSGKGSSKSNQYFEEKNKTYQSSAYGRNATKRPTPITKGRVLQNPRPQPPQEDIPHFPKTAQVKSSFQNSIAEADQQTPGFSTAQEFKTILDFELSIIREQNRLQMLHLQKKMEQSFMHQIKMVQDDMARQLASFRNEVNGRLLVINDSVVNKVADIYSDITMLKNDREITQPTFKNNVSAELSSLNDNCQDFYQENKPSSVMPHQNYARQVPYELAESMQNHQHQYMKESEGKVSVSENPIHLAQNPNASQPINTLHQIGYFQTEPLSQQARQFTNKIFRDNQTNNTSTCSLVENRLMAMRKEKMFERDNESQYQSQPGTDNFLPASSNHVNYPKMDHFSSSNTELDRKNDGQQSHMKTVSSSIISDGNLDPEKINPDLLFNLFGVYGIVQRVKMSQQDKARAYIEMGDSSQAEEAIRYLNNVRLMGSKLHVALCHFDQLKFNRQEFQSNTSKDFTKPQLQRLNRFKPGMWSSQNLYPPSEKLKISNVLSSVSDEKIREVFASKGFTIQNIFNLPCPNNEKKIVLATMSSVDEAVEALTVMNLTELSDWMTMRISFAKPDKRFTNN